MSNAIPLRNDHCVYVLGAGYSVARGLPLISSFLNLMRDAALWCEGAGRASEASAIHDVLRFRLDAAAAAYRVPIDLENIEELFSLASAADPRIANSVKLSIAATIAYCEHANPVPQLHFSRTNLGVNDLDTFSVPDSLPDGAARKIDLYTALGIRILQLQSADRTSIISFNYDDLVEQAIVRLGGRYYYGFKGKHEIEDGVPYSPDGVAILKLHGSINWAYPGVQGKKFTIYKSYESLYEKGLTPQIVPPTWNKTIADRLAEVWSTAIERLSTATKIIIIGFSMPKTDQHFKYLLAAGMKNNLSLREIVFIDPAKIVEERAPEVLAPREIENGRVRFIRTTVQGLMSSAVETIPGRFIYREGGARPF